MVYNILYNTKAHQFILCEFYLTLLHFRLSIAAVANDITQPLAAFALKRLISKAWQQFVRMNFK